MRYESSKRGDMLIKGRWLTESDTDLYGIGKVTGTGLTGEVNVFSK